MRLAIISDTHDNLAWLKRVTTYLASLQLDGLVHCGDVQTVETLRQLCTDFGGPVWVACDAGYDELDELIQHRTPWPGTLRAVHDVIELPEAQLAATHRPDRAAALAATGRYVYVCYGHTHLPWEKPVVAEGQERPVRLFNPGNLCGVRARPTFATLDTVTDDLRLHAVETLTRP